MLPNLVSVHNYRVRVMKNHHYKQTLNLDSQYVPHIQYPYCTELQLQVSVDLTNSAKYHNALQWNSLSKIAKMPL